VLNARFRFFPLKGLGIVAVFMLTAGSTNLLAAEIADDALPEVYLPLLSFEGVKLQALPASAQKGEVVRAYQTPDASTAVRIDTFPCAVNVCNVILQSSLRGMNQQISQSAGSFELISPTEIRASWTSGGTEIHRFAFMMPGSVVVWSLAHTGTVATTDMDKYQKQLDNAINHERFEEALKLGIIDLGRFGDDFRKYAESLVAAGQEAEARRVLETVTVASPGDYKAKLDFAAITSDSSAAHSAASIVLNNAESPQLLADSAAILHTQYPADPVPILQKGEKGLQLILIPLAPCDPQLLQEAGKVFTQITGIPSKVRRLPDEWVWHSPDRMPNERAIQQFIAQSRNENVDFSSWSLAQYEAELISISKNADPITRYNIKKALDQSSGSNGQYTADNYLKPFADLIAPYRSGDLHTIYVGVTSANISSGDANYVFAESQVINQSPATILSYYMMTSGHSGQAVESRARLAARIGKQLVPPAFYDLGLPKSADPNDPSSYANGIEAVDQKSLVLSSASRDALEKLTRGAP